MHITTDRMKHWGTGLAMQTITVGTTGILYAILNLILGPNTAGLITSLLYTAITTHSLGYTGKRLAEYQKEREQNQDEPAEPETPDQETDSDNPEPEREDTDAEREEGEIDEILEED